MYKKTLYKKTLYKTYKWKLIESKACFVQEWPALYYLTRRYFKEEMEYLMVDGLLDGPLGYLAEYLVSVESVELIQQDDGRTRRWSYKTKR